MVKDTINEQSTKDYFAVYEKAENIKLKPTKYPNEMLDDNGTGLDLYIWNTGRVMSVDKADSTNKLMGKMEILSDNSYKLVWTNGYTYDSSTGSIEKTVVNPVEKPKINTVNCANQLVDIANDPTKRKILKFGCKTQAVKELQTLLNVVGKDGVPTGYFGSKTKQAVIDFQKKNQLEKKEGIVGPETYKALTPNAVPTTLNENDDLYDDDYNELDNLFNKNFDTEDDYDGEPFRGDDDGFSNKMRNKQIYNKMKLSSTGLDTYYKGGGDLKSNTVPRDEKGKEVKWSPLKSDDLPLNKYLEKKKMGNLDEDEDIAMLDNLFTKD
jgi:hypothetical protein